MRVQLGRRVAFATAAAILLATGGMVATVQADGTTYGPGLDCPPQVVTLQTLISMAGFAGPLATQYHERLNERGLSCFRGAEQTVVAFRGSPEGLGGATRYAIEPAWLATWNEPRSFLAASDIEIEPGFVSGPFLTVAVPPDLRPRFDSLSGNWVLVHGHFDDAAATTCQFGKDPTGSDRPTKSDLIAMCRTSFVVTGLDATARPCPTGTIDWAAISATPEHLRADCFGKLPLHFVARGFSINNILPVSLPPVRQWELLDPDGDPASPTDRDTALEVFVPDDLEIPSPSDAPWHDRDGVGGSDVFWQVDAHVDDPRAAACRPSPDAMEVDGRLVTWSDEDAFAYCHNHLFIDRLEWIRPAAPSGTPVAPSGALTAVPSVDAVPAAAAVGRRAVPPDNGALLAAGILIAGAAVGFAIGIGLARRRRS
jgi:hypothetical protein